MRKQNFTLKIGSYNIKNGEDVGYDYSLIARDIAEAGVDVCGLQEVDENTLRNQKNDTMKLLSDASGYPYFAFSKSIDLQGGAYGTGVLSKYPIVSYETFPLESDGYEGRSVGHAVIDVNGVFFDYFNTHLSFEDKNTRKKQFAELSAIVSAKSRWALTGDFNTEDFSEFEAIRDAVLVNRAESKLLSYAHGYAIDNIVLSSGATILEKGIADKADRSDHNMIYAAVSFVP